MSRRGQAFRIYKNSAVSGPHCFAFKKPVPDVDLYAVPAAAFEKVTGCDGKYLLFYKPDSAPEPVLNIRNDHMLLVFRMRGGI